jgi:hypothetical protein
MKNLILTLKGTDTKTLRDAFFVLCFIAGILLLVQMGYAYHLIKNYSWQ